MDPADLVGSVTEPASAQAILMGSDLSVLVGSPDVPSGAVAGRLAGTVLGAIRWSRTLGRPLGPTLAAGFLLTHLFWEELWHVTAEGVVVDYRGWRPASNPPRWWDATDDEVHYRVNFLVNAPVGRHELDVVMTPTRWEASSLVNAGYRWLDPPGRVFEKGEGILLLPDFEVRFHETGPQ